VHPGLDLDVDVQVEIKPKLESVFAGPPASHLTSRLTNLADGLPNLACGLPDGLAELVGGWADDVGRLAGGVGECAGWVLAERHVKLLLLLARFKAAATFRLEVGGLFVLRRGRWRTRWEVFFRHGYLRGSCGFARRALFEGPTRPPSSINVTNVTTTSQVHYVSFHILFKRKRHRALGLPFDIDVHVHVDFEPQLHLAPPSSRTEVARFLDDDSRRNLHRWSGVCLRDRKNDGFGSDDTISGGSALVLW